MQKHITNQPEEETQDEEENYGNGIMDMSRGTEVGIAAFFVTAPLIGIGAELMGWGFSGLAAAALGAGVIGAVGKKVVDDDRMRGHLPHLNLIDRFKQANWGALINGSINLDAEEEEQQGDNTPTAPSLPSPQRIMAASPEEAAIFAQVKARKPGPGVERITIEQIARHTEYNSYVVYIGRSMTKEGNPAVSINLLKKHIKLIGATQKGKSSMAIALLDIITRTHDTQHALIALLDLEDKASRLFANSAHIANIELSTGERISMHARNPEEVLHRLIILVQLMEYRYTLDQLTLEAQPVIFTYLEEFIDLKNHFKSRAANTPEKERKQAVSEYNMLLYCIDKLARRGLKARIQFLLCAQVNYRDKDIQEAFVNISNGISFSVRVTAAQAAGFMNVPLLRRNALDDYDGQAVIEMPELKDIVLAPDFDLSLKLRELAEKELKHTERQVPPLAHRPNQATPIPQAPPQREGRQQPAQRTGMYYRDDDEQEEEELDDFEEYEGFEEAEEEIPELTEREQQYQQVLDVWERIIPPHGKIDSIRKLADVLEIKFNEARELLKEMSKLGLLTWKNQEEKAGV